MAIDELLEFCEGNFDTLCRCQNGNYIIQELLIKSNDEFKVKILNFLKENFMKLSVNKFARYFPPIIQ